MSITATSPVSHSLAERLHALLSPLFAGKSAQGRLYRELEGFAGLSAAGYWG